LRIFGIALALALGSRGHLFDKLDSARCPRARRRPATARLVASPSPLVGPLWERAHGARHTLSRVRGPPSPHPCARTSEPPLSRKGRGAKSPAAQQLPGARRPTKAYCWRMAQSTLNA
jgi:hypothetical protein